MPSIGPLYPTGHGTLANGAAGEDANAWLDTLYLVADYPGLEAVITALTYDAPDISQLLYAYNFGFTVPADATIDGIVVEVNRRSMIAGSGKDFRVQLGKGVGGAGLVGSNKADTATIWPSTLTVATYGGPTDLWGTTWTPAEVNDSSTDARFTVSLSCRADIQNADVAVDFIRVTVYYSTAPTGPQVFVGEVPATMYAGASPATPHVG